MLVVPSDRECHGRVMRPLIVWRGVAAALALACTTSAAATTRVCPGDCDGDGAVTAADLAGLVEISLDRGGAAACVAGDTTCDDAISVDEIVAAAGRDCVGTPPRGELAVAASPPMGLLDEIPDGPLVGGTPRMPAQYGVADPAEVEVQVVATGLEVPWAIDFAADGRLFVSERPGRIRVVAGGDLDPIPWVTIDVDDSTSEGGLMGMALHPDFPAEPWVYACYTAPAGAGEINRISRWREVDGRGRSEEILLGDIPAASIHDGCRLKFGPDGMLYASTGDAGQRDPAQDLGSPLGKILRLRPDGSVPADNPFGPTSPVYSYGHRNPQGLAFRPSDGLLLSTEHGPSFEFGLRARDEVNVIAGGGNYGWPEAVGAPSVAPFRDPLLMYAGTALPPAGASFYAGAAIPAWTGDFFFASLGQRHLHRVVFDRCDRVVELERLFANAYGRLRDVVEGPDGALYVATSNRDGRGRPTDDDDRILRLAAAAQ